MLPSDSVLVRPARNVLGSLRVPGDKSISHRYAMLAALAPGRSRFENYSPGADCNSTLGCVRALGCNVERDEKGAVVIEGIGPQLKPPSTPLDCGNSGSTMRMLSGIVAAQPFTSEMIGDESLSRRPMKRVMEPLRRMGAEITATDDHAPLRIRGTRLNGIDYVVPVASAQVKTCLLFAGLLAEGQTTVEEPTRTRDHGELALRAFGAEVSRSRNSVTIKGGQPLHPLEAFIPGDSSSAAFFLCAAATFAESNLVIDGMLLNPTRSALLDVLAAMGCHVKMMRVDEQHGELVGTIALVPGGGKSIEISGAQTALLIDELPVLAATAPFGAGLMVHDAAELRVKESDRLTAVTRNLQAMGARVEQTADGWRIPGGQKVHGAEIESFGDHRIAMAFAIAALRAEGETIIHNAGCVAISYPGFFADLDSILER
ncbi:MAG TPA: 3-phosphoshikimate 1-carboxyvinyltransferase [Candidatus Eisenbacteria bacterium]|nr:3-phosphoshikimate 1-carboxyvinyltransferase [Candidatus Eisenbacteria bacterium]